MLPLDWVAKFTELAVTFEFTFKSLAVETVNPANVPAAVVRASGPAFLFVICATPVVPRNALGVNTSKSVMFPFTDCALRLEVAVIAVTLSDLSVPPTRLN